jgi:hypothetical protein
MPLRPTLLRAICVLALAAACAPPRAAAEISADWLPLREGAVWSYDTHRDFTVRPVGAALIRGLHVGRTRNAAESAPQRAPGAFVVRETTTLRPAEGVGEKVQSTAWVVYAMGKELRVLAASEESADGTKGEVVYDPPLRILPTTTVGEKWNVGTLRNGGQRAKVTGEVLGVEDLDGEPRWTGALKVRLAGDLTGTTGTSDPPAKIESGTYERLLWFVRGVGIVRDVTTVALELQFQGEQRASTFDVLTLRLVEHHLPE